MALEKERTESSEVDTEQVEVTKEVWIDPDDGTTLTKETEWTSDDESK